MKKPNMSKLDIDVEALRKSEEHWEQAHSAKTPGEVNLGPEECALCQQYFNKSACRGCPIKEKTGQTTCDGTPYTSSYLALADWKYHHLVLTQFKNDESHARWLVLTTNERKSREKFRKASLKMLRFIEDIGLSTRLLRSSQW